MASSGRRRPPAAASRVENPFSVKVLQVFTGFGVGCGVGIGVGRPIYLGAIPGLQQVMSATRGATDAFSGVTRHVNTALRKAGLKNIEAGIGCGVGIGHGFGVGLALKPGVVHGIQSSTGEMMSKLMVKLKDVPGMSSASNVLSGSLPSSTHAVGEPQSTGAPNSRSMELQPVTATSSSHQTTSSEIFLQQPNLRLHEQNGMQSDMATGSRTENVIANFLQSPLFRNDTETNLSRGAGSLQGMNNVLQVLLRHQKVIEELREENIKLHKILLEDLNVSPSKLRADHRSTMKAYYPCSDCFECRRRSRRAR